MYKIKGGPRLFTKDKRNRKEKKTEYNRLELTSDPVFTGLKKLQRYVTGTILCKSNSDLTSSISWLPNSILKGRTIIRV